VDELDINRRKQVNPQNKDSKLPPIDSQSSPINKFVLPVKESLTSLIVQENGAIQEWPLFKQAEPFTFKIV
jgi:hypothetical protein